MADDLEGVVQSHQGPLDLCFGCNYRLHSLTMARCPECGRAFDPNDERTRNTTGVPIGAFRRRFVWLPAWPVPVLAIALFLVQLWMERMPRGARLWYDARLQSAWAGVILVWVIVALVAPAVGYGLPADLRPRRRRWLRFMPGFAVLVLLASVYHWGFHLGFAISRPALERFAAETRANPIRQFKPQWVGLYHVDDVFATNRFVMLQISKGGYWAYAPDDKPKWGMGSGIERDILPLGPQNWYIVFNGWPTVWLHDQAADDYCLHLLAAPDASPQTADYLIGLLARKNPLHYFGYGTRVSDEIFVPNTNYAPQPFIYYSDLRGRLRPDIQAMVRLGPRAVDPLAAALAAHKPPMNYLGALGILGPAAAPALPHILPYLADTDPRIRQAAVWALGRIGLSATDRSAALLPLLNDPDLRVRFEARIALESLHPGVELAPRLIGVWQKAIAYYDGPSPAMRYSESAWSTRVLVVDQLSRAGPKATAVLPQILQTLQESIDYLRANKAPLNNPETTAERDYASAWNMRHYALQDIAKMIGSMGPLAKSAEPSLLDALAFSLRHQTYRSSEMWIDDENALQATLQAITPGDPQIKHTLLSLLDEGLAIAPLEAREHKDAPERLVYFNRRRIAELLRASDPENAEVRLRIRAGLAAGVESPERLWAVEMCPQFPLPANEVFAPLREMVEKGSEPACLAAALYAPAALGKGSAPLAPLLIARIDAYWGEDRSAFPAGQRAAPVDPPKAFTLLPGLDPDSPAVAACLQHYWESRQFTSARDALKHLKAPGDADLPDLVDWIGVQDQRQNVEALRRMGPQAKRLVRPLIQRLGTAASSDEQAYVLRLLQEIGPDAAEAIPAIVPLLLVTPRSSWPREPALRALAHIGWTPAVEKAIRELAAQQRLDLSPRGEMSEFGPELLPVLLDLPAAAQPQETAARAEAIFRLARQAPTPLDKLAPWAKIYRMEDTVLAVVKSQGTDQAKRTLLIELLQDNYASMTWGPAARALVELKANEPAAREALFARAWSTDSLATRDACAKALEQLSPEK